MCPLKGIPSEIKGSIVEFGGKNEFFY